MAHESVAAAVKAFLANSEPGVLCIRGLWGVGKTFAWKQWLSEAVALKAGMPWGQYSYCSLFGVNSIGDMKSTIFENAVPLDAEMKIPASSWEGLMRRWKMGVAKVKKHSWLAPNVLSMVPHSGRIGDASARLLFLFVRDQLICIDDVERRGASLAMGDVLGMVSHLKEERRCKVVLILNDEWLGTHRAEFDRYLEKVIDIALVFQPSPEEIVAIGVGDKWPFYEQIAQRAVALEIRNIRVIQRIKRLVDQVQPFLADHDPRLLSEAIKTLTVLGWIEFMRDVAPPWEFVRNRFLVRAQMQIERTDEGSQHKRWNALLDKVDMGELTELDMQLQIGVAQGYFDREALTGFAELMARRLVRADMDRKLMASFHLYGNTLKPNDAEVVAAFMDTVKSEAKIIPAASLNAVVEALKRLERPAEATELIEYVLNIRRKDESFFRRAREPITDPELLAALQANTPVQKDDRPLEKILVEGLFGYGGLSIVRLQKASVSELKAALSTLDGAWEEPVEALLRQSAIATNGNTVRENAMDALRQLSQESIANRLRLGKILLNPPELVPEDKH
jgi:hypothetical protein